ncbi:O-phosphoserine--tRNA ligase [archaeon CG07_land_8_20_14_0_80_38_8]|nr:MAG: O-phosphoserine--tRNA ligase [archaeon CG07_land_8_20_14_0_80_38_8]
MYPVGILKKEAEEDFYKAWNNSKKLIPLKGLNYEFPKRRGESHILYDYEEKFRQILLNMGFDELILKPFWEDVHVKMQYGPEAPAILDRVYYTASIPRPDIGISKDREKDIKKISKKATIKVLKNIFRDYKMGKIDPGDLMEELVVKLKINSSEAGKILSLFPEMEALKPVPSNNTLLSHFTTAWFPTLASMVKNKNLPVQLFTTGWRFRREQKEDATHLKAHYNSSIVIMNKELSLEDAENITRKVMSALGFPEVKIVYKEHNAVYYAPGTDFEVFAETSGGKMLEVADGGLYSPISLAKYGIPYSVFNLGPSLHRTVMIKEGYNDVRNFTYPYEYENIELTDKELAGMIHYDSEPSTEEARMLAEILEKKAIENRGKKGPVSVKVFDDEFMNKKVVVEFFEPDKDETLLGSAALNKVIVYNGNVYGLPDKGLNEEAVLIRKKGVKTNITFLKGIINSFVKQLENTIINNGKELELRDRMVKRASELNINIKRAAKYYITSKKAVISLKGPVFIGIKGIIKD